MPKFIVSDSTHYQCEKGPARKNLCRLVTRVTSQSLKGPKRGAGVDQTGAMEPRFITEASCETNADCRVPGKNCVGYDAIGRNWTNDGKCSMQNKKLDTDMFCLANGKCAKKIALQPYGLLDHETRADCATKEDCTPEQGKVCITTWKDNKNNVISQTFPCPATDFNRGLYNRCISGKCYFNEK
jgi:hypothetical protein